VCGARVKMSKNSAASRIGMGWFKDISVMTVIEHSASPIIME
jgi:hypothetical protein